MYEAILSFLDRLLGLSREALELEARQMIWRAVVVFSFAIFLARVAGRRMLAHNAGFDIVLLVILGSVLSRAINGQAAFFPTLAASAGLVALHYVVATLSFNFHWFSQFVKGRAQTLVRDGKVDREQMRRAKFTDDDLDENLRLNGGVDSTDHVAEARLERNGSISVVKVRDTKNA
jgi:uncharacterized membrane protein YcaP (DUF421 family)